MAQQCVAITRVVRWYEVVKTTTGYDAATQHEAAAYTSHRQYARLSNLAVCPAIHHVADNGGLTEARDKVKCTTRGREDTILQAQGDEQLQLCCPGTCHGQTTRRGAPGGSAATRCCAALPGGCSNAHLQGLAARRQARSLPLALPQHSTGPAVGEQISPLAYRGSATGNLPDGIPAVADGRATGKQRA